MNYLHLYADNDGKSHFGFIDEPMTVKPFAPPAPPLQVSEFRDAKCYGFLRIDPGVDAGWHCSPARQMMFFLSGEFEVTVSDGETRRLRPGQVILLDDTVGEGHRTRIVSADVATAAVVQL